MTTTRLEAFSDGVIAIIITIMVLELKVPRDPTFVALRPMLPVFLSYLLSFVFVGIYWNNHHHLLHLTRRVTGGILWANLHLLFWLSLVPFATAWRGADHSATAPTVAYGVVLLMSAIAFTILQTAIQVSDGPDSPLSSAVGADLKGKISLAFYFAAIGLAFVYEPLADALFIAVALIWLVPDRRIERATNATQ
jgi:uncharacterized membrane protein